MNSWLFTGKVSHRRMAKTHYEFTHSIFYIRFPLTQISKLEIPLFSLNRWNLLSFYAKDHGNRDGTDLWAWGIEQAKLAGISTPISEIVIQTFPRVLGFVFNPISLWFFYSDKEQVAVLAEVNNTFGESHSYFIPRGTASLKKTLHVSPFFKIHGNYDFSFSESEDGTQNSTGIRYNHSEQTLLFARIWGRALPWTSFNLLKTWLGHPLMTFWIVFLIHWHAIRLFLKGVPFYGKDGTTKELS